MLKSEIKTKIKSVQTWLQANTTGDEKEFINKVRERDQLLIKLKIIQDEKERNKAGKRKEYLATTYSLII